MSGCWENISKTEKKFIEFLYDSGCIKIGEFKSKRGRVSPYFVEMQESFNSKGLKIVGKAYVEKISKLPVRAFNLIVAAAEKGIPLGIATALCLLNTYGIDIPVFWDRKQPKDYGTQKRPCWIVGPYGKLEKMVKEQITLKPIIIDDVITTGATKKEVMNKFEGEVSTISQELQVNPPRIEWIGMYIAVNRREVDEMGRNPIEVFQSELGVPIHSITDSYKIYAHLGSKGIISKKEIHRFIEYQAQYGLPEDRGKLEALRKRFI